MTKTYSVAQLWIDTMENHNAYGYSMIGFTSDENLIKQLNEIVVKKDMFPYPLNYVQNNQDTVPWFKIREITLLNDISDIDFRYRFN
jgi:hypothetical protein